LQAKAQPHLPIPRAIFNSSSGFPFCFSCVMRTGKRLLRQPSECVRYGFAVSDGT
jgi:hypothetical protein